MNEYALLKYTVKNNDHHGFIVQQHERKLPDQPIYSE